MPQAFCIACRSDDAQLAAGEYIRRLALAGPHIGQRQHARFDDQCHFVPGIVTAQVRAAIFDDEPPHTLAWPRIGKTELNHDTAPARKFAELHKTPHVPHQKAGIELTGLQPAADPARTPVTERHHDRAQLLAGCRQPVFIGARAMDALDDADLLELAQPLREQRRRHARHATADVVEPYAAAQQLTYD